jgi:hypothetical protein
MTETCARIPPLAFELALSGEPPPGPHAEQWLRHIATCPACGARLEEARTAGERWAASPQAARLPGRQQRRRWLVAPVVLAAAAAVLLLWPRGEEFRAKAGASLGLLVQRGAQTARWTGGPLRVGDLVQPIWTSARAEHPVLLVRTRAGEVTVLYAEPAAVPPGVDRPLGRSLVVNPDLDGAALWAVRGDAARAMQALRVRGQVDAAVGPPVVLQVQPR